MSKYRHITIDGVNKLAFVGDIHGGFLDMCYGLSGISDAAVVVCGDIGMGFDARYDLIFDAVNPVLERNNITVVLFRGNHDDPAWFNDERYKDYQHGDRWSNIFLIPDYTLVTAAGHTVLCIGGALSIDRCARTKSVSYWADEDFVEDLDKIDALETVCFDIVATHSCPDTVGPHFNGAMGYEAYDPTLMNELSQERDTIESVRRRLRQSHDIRYWFYGHFHRHYEDTHDGTLFIGLDMLRKRKLDMYILDKA